MAEPLISGTGAPKLEPSILNCTVPVGDVGIATHRARTVAVKVTAWPAAEGRPDAPAGASRPEASVSSGAAAALLPSGDRPYMFSTVRRIEYWLTGPESVPGTTRFGSRR